jgi:hypothetical protein
MDKALGRPPDMSKRFTFRLDSLRRFRQHRTNQAKLALGQVAVMRYEKEQEIEQRVRYLQEFNGEVATK